MNFETILLAAGIPSAITAFCFWLIQHSLTERDKKKDEERKARYKKQDEDEQKREQLQLFMIQSIDATMELSEATAKAIQRIPDAHCNGDMQSALEKVDKVRSDRKTFIEKQGLQHILN